ncbi:hypothetical protein KY362_02770 [Candidatus Woesearchaeota archaeon]|nr:hypothetical protein [Candidatus Woesearchaeota archaeon]
MVPKSVKGSHIATEDEVKHIVERFSSEIRKELTTLVKSVVWFGSALKKGAFHKDALRDETLFGSDIDVLIVIDDLVHVITPEVVTAYRIVTEKTAAKVSRRLHITTMPLTRFWDYTLKGDPILINMLKHGVIMYDTGCFGMAQNLLTSKKVEPGREVVHIYLGRAPQAISNANWNIKQAILDLYWAVFDAAHSALLSRGVVPDAPEQLVPLVKDHLVSQGILHKRYLSILSEFMNTGRMVMGGEMTRVSGDHYDRYHAEAKEFLKAVKEILAKRHEP